MDANPRSKARRASRAASRGMVCVLLAACAFSSGCATAINGRTQRVAVASDPPGAQVYVNDAPAGVTPAFVDVPRRDPDLKLRLEKEGHEPAVLAPERSRSGWMAGNVLFAGVPINEYTLGMWVGAMAVYGALGSLWDVVRGGAYKRPELVRATLAPLPPPANAANAEGRRDSPSSAPSSGAPGVAAPKLRNRLVPMRHAHGVQRLTGPRSEPARFILMDVTDGVTLDRDQELRRQADGSRLRGARRSPLAGADSTARTSEVAGEHQP